MYVIRLFLAEGVCVTSANSSGQDAHVVHIVIVGFGRQTIWSTDVWATASTDPNPNPNPDPTNSYRGRSLSVQDNFGTYTFGACFFRYIQFRYIECQYRYSDFWYIQNIGTVHFGTIMSISVQACSIQKDVILDKLKLFCMLFECRT